MTIDSEQMAQLLVELGERVPRVQGIVQEAEAARWAIELEDETVILAELDEGLGRLSLETDLGKPPEEHRLATCEALMMFTSLEHAAGGIAMALSEPGGEFQLCAHLSESDLQLDKLESSLLSFSDHARQWRDVVARGAQPRDASEAQMLDALHLA